MYLHGQVHRRVTSIVNDHATHSHALASAIDLGGVRLVQSVLSSVRVQDWKYHHDLQAFFLLFQTVPLPTALKF